MINAGDKTDFGRTFWAPPLDRDGATTEIELSMGAGTTEQRRVADFHLACSHAFLTL